MEDTFDNERFRKLLLCFPNKAIELLYHRYYRVLLHIAMKLTHDEKAAEDILQETFVHIWENHKRLGQHHERSIQYYLVRVVKNKAITHYKETIRLTEKKFRFFKGQTFNLKDFSIEEKMIRGEINQEVRQLIATFPRREKECLLMKMDEEMSSEQIAIKLNVSKKAVERSITSANKRLRKYWLSRK